MRLGFFTAAICAVLTATETNAIILTPLPEVEEDLSEQLVMT